MEIPAEYRVYLGFALLLSPLVFYFITQFRNKIDPDKMLQEGVRARLVEILEQNR